MIFSVERVFLLVLLFTYTILYNTAIIFTYTTFRYLTWIWQTHVSKLDEQEKLIFRIPILQSHNWHFLKFNDAVISMCTTSPNYNQQRVVASPITQQHRIFHQLWKYLIFTSTSTTVADLGQVSPGIAYIQGHTHYIHIRRWWLTECSTNIALHSLQLTIKTLDLYQLKSSPNCCNQWYLCLPTDVFYKDV